MDNHQLQHDQVYNQSRYKIGHKTAALFPKFASVNVNSKVDAVINFVRQRLNLRPACRFEMRTIYQFNEMSYTNMV